MSGGPIHLNVGAGQTACGQFIPDLADGERYWYPGDEPSLGPGPVTCLHCLAGARAPTSPRVIERVVAQLRALPADEDRLAAFGQFCTACGGTTCTCRRDG